MLSDKPKLISWPTILAAGAVAVVTGGVLLYLGRRSK